MNRFFYIFNILFVTGLISVSIISCENDNKNPDRNWELIWSDEFNGEAGESPDPSKWTYDIGRGTDGWGNQESQYYTNRPENVSMDGEGHLNIVAIEENYMGASYTSARIKTQGIFESTYGRYEARIKTPSGQGIWPAFWLLGANIEDVSWPQCGEIDIMELRGQQPNVIHGSLHGPGYSAGNAVTDSYVSEGRFDTEFHVYAVEWGEDYIDFFVDDRWYQSISPDDLPGEWVFDHPFFIIMNTAVGGTFLGYPDATTPFPQTMQVDYVRVYREN